MDIFSKDTHEFLIEEGHPVLLIGDHGVGKTSVVRAIGNNFGLTMHELNAGTLDPFVHIVGIPVVSEGKVTMNPPDALMAAEILFIDEINRSDRQTRNALFEIICDKSVNGKKLPNLKLIVAAMNPPDGQYQVDALDKALDDRFLFRFNVGRDISFALQHIDEERRDAVAKWYNALEEPPSPRRLTWALQSSVKDGVINEAALLNALDDTLYSTSSLIRMLTVSSESLDKISNDPLLSEPEQILMAKIAYSLVTNNTASLNADMREKLRSYSSWLPSPHKEVEDARAVFGSSEFIKGFDRPIEFTYTISGIEFPELDDYLWLDKLMSEKGI